MFYSQIILARKGPLGKIWLAAHFDKKLSKNQILSTDIPNSVESVLNPASPLALRVSGHLMLGIVRIYSRKVKYLLSDCTEAMWKIKLAFRPGDVDIDPTLLLNLNNVDDARFFGNVVAENDFNDLETAAFPQFLLSTFATQPTVSATTKTRRSLNNVHEDGNVSSVSTPFDAEDFEGHRDEQRRSASSNNNRSRISMLDEGRKSNISDSNRFNDDIPAFDDNDLMDLDLGLAAGAINASTPTSATKPLLSLVQKDDETDAVLPVEEFDAVMPEDMPSFDFQAYEPADEVIAHVSEPQKRVRTEKQQVRESPAVKRSTKRHRVEIDLRVELSTQQIKERMADMRPILRRDPDLPLPFKMQRTSHLLEREHDLFAERDESSHLTLEEQLLMPASVRGLCPELQALFTMTTAREPSLPFQLREEFRVRAPGRSAMEKELSGSAAEEVLAQRQVQKGNYIGLANAADVEQDVLPQFEEVPGEEFRANHEGDYGPAMEPPIDDFNYAAQEQEDFVNSSANLGGGSDVSTRASTKGAIQRKQSHFLSMSKNSVSEEISRAVEQQGLADQQSVSGKATVSSNSAHSLNERTRAILTILEEQFQHKVSVSFEELSSGVTRRVAAGAFLEVLQLKTRGMLQVTQDEPFGMITVMPVRA